MYADLVPTSVVDSEGTVVNSAVKELPDPWPELLAEGMGRGAGGLGNRGLESRSEVSRQRKQ